MNSKIFDEPTQENYESLQNRLRVILKASLFKEEIYHLFCMMDEDADNILLSLVGDLAKEAAPQNFEDLGE